MKLIYKIILILLFLSLGIAGIKIIGRFGSDSFDFIAGSISLLITLPAALWWNSHLDNTFKN